MDRAAGQVWTAPDQFGYALIALGMDRYGEDALDWAPETWRHEVEHDTGAVIPPDNCDRLMAAVVVHEHPHLFYDSVQDFPTLCAVLAGEVPGDPPDLADITWGVFEARLIVRTPPDKFHPHVRGLVTAVAEEEGAGRAGVRGGGRPGAVRGRDARGGGQGRRPGRLVFGPAGPAGRGRRRPPPSQIRSRSARRPRPGGGRAGMKGVS